MGRAVQSRRPEKETRMWHSYCHGKKYQLGGSPNVECLIRVVGAPVRHLNYILMESSTCNSLLSVPMNIIGDGKIDCLTLGIYIRLLRQRHIPCTSIKTLRAELGLSADKMRKSINLLEDEGYIARTPIQSASGRFIGWSYDVFENQLPLDKRTNAGHSKTDLL